jgi:hypothetical protein
MIVNWDEFAATAPELAEFGRERITRDGAVLLGTIRADGTPRISPVEAYFFEGAIALGMMWRSRKALDLERDPRCLLHTLVLSKDGRAGEFKLRGQAVDIPEPARRQRYADLVFAAIDWRPTEPYHLCEIDIESAAYIDFSGDGLMRLKRWPGPARMVHATRLTLACHHLA